MYRRYLLVLFLLILQVEPVFSQTDTMDIGDVYQSVFRKNRKADTSAKRMGSLVLLPTIGYTPSTGFEFGIDVSGTRYFGNPENTTLSVFDAYAALSTGGLSIIQLKHNGYTRQNKWNFQGSWDVGKTVMLDHGIGTTGNDPGEFQLNYRFLKLSENVYKELFHNFFIGGGIAINYYSNIDNAMQDTSHPRSFNETYSLENGYSPDSYFANGLLLNIQYNSRDQPYRPYRGIYFDVLLKTNKKWMGSEKSGLQLKTELRKYFSLSTRNPEHVLAYWLWASYLLKGSVPYLELPGTGSDIEQRTGRGYTIGRFKGPSYFYQEAEYRFPLLRNKLLSGVLFLNMESAGDQGNTRLFNYWEPGGGAGLRILFNKHTRSNLCIDYGIGNYGSKGVFVGLNEVF
ncbi:BamA/TamA family outer membrane protein [Pedobacter sp. AW31-3R]|uniref:BamA/TamA family outer membrane protein n=1 Tax=Pedobacter sp. AW31-3R TaxID=3445781 RepID=UPI003F9FD895